MTTGFEQMTAAEHRERTVLAWTEKQFQAQVVGLAKELGYWTHHHYDSRRSSAGWPDLVLLRDDTALFVELKSGTGRLSPAQREVIAKLTAAGLTTHVWRPRHWLDGTIHHVLMPGTLTPGT